jgi:hypothetical protein
MAERTDPAKRGGENTVTSPGQKRETTKSWDHKEDTERDDAMTFATSRVLQIKRWEVQEGPFRGFNSPPGRF